MKINKIIIIMFLLVLSFLIGCTKSNPKGMDNKEFTILNLKSVELINIVNGGEKITGEQLDSSYVLLLENKDGSLEQIQRGVLKNNSWEAVKVYESGLYRIFCYGKNTYSSISSPNKAFINVSEDKSIDIVCTQWKPKEPVVNITGNLKDNNILSMQINTLGKIRQLTLCFDWSVGGILSLDLTTQPNKCKDYSWLNYTCYYPKNETSKKDYYCWLPEKQYYCSSKEEVEEITTCDKVEYDSCYVNYPAEVVPDRYKDRVYKCFYGGGEFFNETKSYEIKIDKSNYIKEGDWLKLFLIDADRRVSDFSTGKVYYSENREDIGMEDKEIELKY